MTPVPARWTKHRPIALGLAREYRVPGMDPDDVHQEALIALWEACRAYDREKPKCRRAPRKAPFLVPGPPTGDSLPRADARFRPWQPVRLPE